MRHKLPYKWPFALDIIYHQYKANQAGKLFAQHSDFYAEHGIGPNIEVKLFGATGFVTFDPRNIEAILSTNFEGRCPDSDISI